MSTASAARMERIREIANAVLYEGYLLYPYRHSAIKNCQRWTLGVVYPRAFSEAHGGTDPWTMRTECLVRGSEATSVSITVRFLHLLLRTTAPNEQADQPEPASGAARGVVGWLPDSWEEGVEREVVAPPLTLSALLLQPRRIPIAFSSTRLVEPASDDPAVEIVREQASLAGAFVVAAECVASAEDEVFKVSVEIANDTPETADLSNRGNAALLRSFVSAHIILTVHEGAFVSLLEPPDALAAAARSCQNVRTWPVLVGDEGDTDALLSSPIILYDYPRIAPESAGSLFDGTEIDEILTLRILALTDEEKAEMRSGDERARAILERTEALTGDQLMKLHGVIRGLRPASDTGATGVGGMP